MRKAPRGADARAESGRLSGDGQVRKAGKGEPEPLPPLRNSKWFYMASAQRPVGKGQGKRRGSSRLQVPSWKV